MALDPASDLGRSEMRTLNVLALNSGSSSLKFGLYGVGRSPVETHLSGEAEFGGDAGTFHATDSRGDVVGV